MLTLNVMKEPINQTWSIERIAREAPPRTWEHVFDDAAPELQDVSTILDEQELLCGEYYPLKKDIFTAFNYTPLPNVKVVILGQDPYHQTINVDGLSMPRAVGLSFSVRREDNIPSSLQNIYTELANTVRGFTKPDHGDLREWAKLGVLLLNTCLTVRPHQAGAHGDIWLGFINKVFKAIAAVNPYCVYMLWGREAQKVKPMLGERSIILEAAHPSGFSARRGFFGCNHFNLANDALIKQGKVGINWKISTLAELNNNSLPQLRLLPGATGEHRQLAPVNVEMLPTIIPIKQPVNIEIPNVLQNNIPKTGGYQMNQDTRQNFSRILGQTQFRTQQTVVPLLQTIPTIRPSSPIVTKSKSPTPPIPTSQSTIVPSIPTIQFGLDINIPPPIIIGTQRTNYSPPSETITRNTGVPYIMGNIASQNPDPVMNVTHNGMHASQGVSIEQTLPRDPLGVPVEKQEVLQRQSEGVPVEEQEVFLPKETQPPIKGTMCVVPGKTLPSPSATPKGILQRIQTQPIILTGLPIIPSVV